jgi:hypothetical protein
MAIAIFWGLAFIVFLQFFTRYVLNNSAVPVHHTSTPERSSSLNNPHLG